MEPTKRRTARTASTPPRVPKTVTTPYDAAANLTTDERMAALLEAALEDGHPQVIAAALGTIARAKGMAKIAKDTGLNPNPSTVRSQAKGTPNWIPSSRLFTLWGCSSTRRSWPDLSQLLDP